MRTYHKWTTSDEHDLVETIRMGGGWSEAAEKIGIGENQAYNHYRAMRRYDKTLPMPPKRENKKTEEETMSKEKMKNPVPDPEACADPKELKPKGELNPSEQEMARMIEEREEEIARLLKNIEELSEELSGRDELIKKLTEKIAKKDRIIAGMAEELYR